MSWLFLLFGFVSATFTWNAFQPVFAPAFPATVSFFAGWLTSELPLHQIAWQALVAMALVAGGGLGQWPGWVGLLLLVSSWGGLLVTQARARGTREAAMQALRDGLGGDFEGRILPQYRPALDPTVPLGQLLYPFRITRPDVVVQRNIVFHEAAAGPDGRRHRLRLDVYRRRDLPTGCPILLYVHGGAWVIGDKERQGLPLLHHMASRGWLCVTISYRLSPRATFPDHLVDVKRAIAWVRAHAAEHGGDAGLMVISGGSAGGHLASLAALTPGRPEYQPGFEAADTTIQGCVSFYGVYDLLDRHGHWPNGGLRQVLERLVMKASPDDARADWERASPIAQVSAAAPPFLCIHGTHDTLVPVADARRFVEALRAVSHQPVVLAEFAGAQHAFEIFPSHRTGISLETVERFLAYVRSQHQAPPARPDATA